MEKQKRPASIGAGRLKSHTDATVHLSVSPRRRFFVNCFARAFRVGGVLQPCHEMITFAPEMPRHHPTIIIVWELNGRVERYYEA
jgi:hypothetical protein